MIKKQQKKPKHPQKIEATEAQSALTKIGKMISQVREDRGMTQADLGAKIGSTQSCIARIENGEQNISTETLAKISNALDREIVTLAPKGTLNFRIHGGRTLKGSIKVRSSKNGAVGILCASLLTTGTTTIKNAPKIEEVHRITEVLNSIGVRTEWKGDDLIVTPPKKLNLDNIDYEAAARTRSCIMLMAPLVHMYKKFNLPQAGGCRLGSRTVKPFFYAFEKLGITIDTDSKYYTVHHSGIQPNEIVLYEAGDVVTETVIMAAAKIPGTTVIKFASANYQVQDVCHYLELLGVKIEGVGTTTVTVHGVANLNQDVTYNIGEDPIEAMSLIAIGIVTKSPITIMRCPIDFLELELLKLEKMGQKFKRSPVYLSYNNKTRLVDITLTPSQLTALEEKIHALPYPGINMDNLPFFAIIGSQAEGQTFIHDWSYEERAIYYKELDKLRADTLLADPHRFYIKGPTKFKATELVCPPALRPSVIIMIGMMAAEGVSVLRNIYNINRGYEDLAERLNKIGAKIETFRDL